MYEIEVGDKVRHKNKQINGGLDMPVIDIEGEQAKCSYFDAEGIHRDSWFNLADLELAQKHRGGFKNPGEE